MTLKEELRRRPVIYEIVPPRRDNSRFQTDLRGVERVLNDSRITAINIPELINRRKLKTGVDYSLATIPPEEYALMIKDHKETIVNIVTPRLNREEFLSRVQSILYDFDVHNLVFVGKERHEDILPGPGVIEALRIADKSKEIHTLGGICIFSRESHYATEYDSGTKLGEDMRVFLKAEAGCEFVTSQITFDSRAAVSFLTDYQRLCRKGGKDPLAVFISLTTVPTNGILSLLENLDVQIPPGVRKRLLTCDDMGAESVIVAAEVLREIIERTERSGITIPLGLQIEQVGINNDELSMRLLDTAFEILKDK